MQITSNLEAKTAEDHIPMSSTTVSQEQESDATVGTDTANIFFQSQGAKVFLINWLMFWPSNRF